MKNKIITFIKSKNAKGITIIAFLITCLTYFITSPFFEGLKTPCGLRLGDSNDCMFEPHGFPWNFASGYPAQYSILFLILDIIFWFIIIWLVIKGIELIKDEK